MTSYTLRTNHIVTNDDTTCEYTLPFDAESEGTKRIFIFGPSIKDALENGRTIVVDEIDNSLHPLFLEYLIQLFNSRETNPNKAQLIFNTHSVETLSLDLLRRDQIYFVEKNHGNGVTELYSLDEFSLGKQKMCGKDTCRADMELSRISDWRTWHGSGETNVYDLIAHAVKRAKQLEQHDAELDRKKSSMGCNPSTDAYKVLEIK